MRRVILTFNLATWFLHATNPLVMIIICAKRFWNPTMQDKIVDRAGACVTTDSFCHDGHLCQHLCQIFWNPTIMLDKVTGWHDSGSTQPTKRPGRSKYHMPFCHFVAWHNKGKLRGHEIKVKWLTFILHQTSAKHTKQTYSLSAYNDLDLYASDMALASNKCTCLIF